MTCHLTVGVALSDVDRFVRVLASKGEDSRRSAIACVMRNADTWRDALHPGETHFWAVLMRPDMTFLGSLEVPKDRALPIVHHDSWATEQMFSVVQSQLRKKGTGK